MKITTDIAEIEHDLAEDRKIVIYRVIQEALTNTVKHAGAENASLLVQLQDDKIICSVVDDGKGFDLERVATKVASEKGLGLATMNERVTMVGGAFDLWSREGKGTKITFSIPVEKGGP